MKTISAAIVLLALAAGASAQIPGLPFPATSELSDQKPGSILFFNYFTSSASANAQNTEITFVNTNTTTAVGVRIFFVNGSGGASASALLTLAPVQTATFLTGDVIPGVTGYLVAVAINPATQCPINFNYLIGRATIKRSSGHTATLSAVAVAALASTPVACSGATAILNFDGVSYNQMSQNVAMPNISSRADSNDTLFIVNRVGGSLTVGGTAGGSGNVFGLLYDDVESVFSFSQSMGPQFVGSLANSFPSTTPQFETVIPALRTGWMQLRPTVGLLGASINFNPNGATVASAFNGGHNLSHLSLISASYTIPLTAPDLTISKTHTGNFTIGGTGAYTITVTNSGTAMSPLMNSISVSDNLPGNLTLASFSGTGWNCSGIGTNHPTCSQNLTLAAGASAAPLTLTVNVGAGTPAGVNSVTNTATVFAIQQLNTANDVASDPTTIVCPSISVNPSSSTLPSGTQGLPYSQSFTHSGAVGTTSWSITAGSLPAGLMLNSASGVLSGTPGVSGNFSFTVTVTDQSGCAGSRLYTLNIGSGSSNGLQFYPLPRPVRLLDTRANQGNCDNISTPITGGNSLTTLARGTCENITIPATAQAIVGNLTVINQTSQIGFLTIYPDGQALPLAANMIYEAGGILSNNFTVGLSSDGKFNIFGERTIDVVVDISGYYAPPGAGGLYYHPLSKPIRLLDTRPNQGNCDNVSAPIPGGTSITAQARTTCESLTIPQAAQAIVGNATVINGSGQVGYLTIYPNGVAPPLAANMVYFPGQILSNAFTVSLSASGEFNIFGERTIDMVIDVAGYYSNEATDANGPGLLFTPLARPLRTLDTRANQGNCDAVSTPIAGGTSIATAAWLSCETITIPNTARAVLGNVTAINQTAQTGFLTLYPDGVVQPLAANMVYFPGQILSNAFVVGVNTGTGQFRIFAEQTLDAIVDVSGYFAP